MIYKYRAERMEEIIDFPFKGTEKFFIPTALRRIGPILTCKIAFKEFSEGRSITIRSVLNP